MGEFEKRLVKIFDKYETDDDQSCAISFLIEEAKKELKEGSHVSWVSPNEPKPAIKYICIEYDKFLRWFGGGE